MPFEVDFFRPASQSTHSDRQMLKNTVEIHRVVIHWLSVPHIREIVHRDQSNDVDIKRPLRCLNIYSTKQKQILTKLKKHSKRSAKIIQHIAQFYHY